MVRDEDDYSAAVGPGQPTSGEYGLDPEDAGPWSVEHTAGCGEFIGKEHTPVIRVYTLCRGCQEVVLTHWW